MRRPIKPFVTEYRSTGRRQGAAGQTSKTDLFAAEMERLEPRPLPESRSFDAGPPEDSYEAALRAADALFSSQRSSSKEPGADAPGAAVTDLVDPVSADAAPSADPTKHPSGGRILRAIDEPVSAELLRLEAEFAPKRRGRKPGSKNKPKVPAAVAEALQQDPPPREVAGAPPVAPQRAASHLASQLLGSQVAASQVAASQIAASQIGASAIAQAVAAGQAALATRGERYAWVRTRLKPGQQWKRRLPKVAW